MIPPHTLPLQILDRTVFIIMKNLHEGKYYKKKKKWKRKGTYTFRALNSSADAFITACYVK